MNVRVGYGEDAHALAAGRPLVIGNIAIPDSPVGAVAHSDGDVLLHALADALLSSHALGDIGPYFPPSDPSFKDMDSADIVRKVLALLEECAPTWRLVNLAAVVILDRPKLGAYREAISRRVAALLELSEIHVGLTFKTSEGLAPGHIQARVTVLLSSAG
ncbi:2-C-methyl-D-erythritol 2,4-cyclodiphosphate synthase [soil metagenome]